MDINALINDIFSSLPERFIPGSDSIEANLGIDLGQGQWTIQVKGDNCTVVNELLTSCKAVIKTGPWEWAGISAGSQDAVALFLAKKLAVEGDLDVALAVMPLFSDYQGEGIEKKEPSWVIDTLGTGFSVDSNGLFHIEDLDCETLAEKFGTPLFVASEARIRENISTLIRAFSHHYPENEVNVMWAVKSNTTLAFRKIMNEEGAGGDCFSPGEVYATFLTGADPDKFLLNGSDRSIETFGMALDLGMRITLDHMDDLYMVEKLAREKEVSARVLIRVKCPLPSLQDLDSTFYPGIAVHLEVTNYKFGVFFDEACDIIKQAQQFAHVEIDGIHSHIGRDLQLPEHWEKYAFDMVGFCAQLKNKVGFTARILDLGGGFSEIRDPSGHDLNRLAPSGEDYAAHVAQGVRKGCQTHDFPFPRLWIEPGRHLIGSTSVLISRVGNVKRTQDVCTWVHTDASTNFLSGAIRHNGMSYHLLPGANARATAEETVDVIGPNCAGDLIQPRRRLPMMSRGDLLIFLDVGAYNMVYANQFNCIPRPASVLVHGSQADIVQERETLQDIFAKQTIPARLLKKTNSDSRPPHL